MLKTKMTIPIRALGVIGTLVLVGSLYLPWATINGKELLDSSGTFSAMDLVQNESKYLSYAFMGVYFILILSLFTLIYSIVGRPTVAMGITQFITAGTYLALLILLGSFFQGVMPGGMKIPGMEALEDTDGDGLLDKIEIEFEEQFATDFENPDSDGDGLQDGEELEPNPYYSNPGEKDSDGDGVDDYQEYQDGSDPWPEFNEQMQNDNGDENKSDGDDNGQDIGDMIESINKINEMSAMITNTTVKAEKGIYITTGSSVFLVIIGIMLKIDRKRRKNLKIELKYHKKDLGAYKMCIEQALLDGYISGDELGMLNMQRRTMGITEEEHYTIVMSMAEGRKADEQCVNELLSILDGNYQYRGEEGAFGRRRRPGRRPPPPREGMPRGPPRGSGGRPRDSMEAPGSDEYPEPDETPPISDDPVSRSGSSKEDEWDF